MAPKAHKTPNKEVKHGGDVHAPSAASSSAPPSEGPGNDEDEVRRVEEEKARLAAELEARKELDALKAKIAALEAKSVAATSAAAASAAASNTSKNEVPIPLLARAQEGVSWAAKLPKLSSLWPNPKDEKHMMRAERQRKVLAALGSTLSEKTPEDIQRTVVEEYFELFRSVNAFTAEGRTALLITTNSDQRTTAEQAVVSMRRATIGLEVHKMDVEVSKSSKKKGNAPQPRPQTRVFRTDERDAYQRDRRPRNRYDKGSSQNHHSFRDRRDASPRRYDDERDYRSRDSHDQRDQRDYRDQRDQRDRRDRSPPRRPNFFHSGSGRGSDKRSYRPS